mgnify:CR=1 FL=1
MTLSGKFTSTPEDHVDATFDPKTGRLEAPFTLSAEFSGKQAAQGEYRQYVRGYYEIDGLRLTHILCGDVELDEFEYHEDGCGKAGGCTAYGHRSCPNYRDARAIDEYLPSRKKGTDFAMLDIPGLGTANPTPGKTLEFHLEFRGVLLDIKTGDELASIEWSAGGSHRFAAEKRSKQVTKLANGKTLHVRLVPEGDTGWRGTLLIAGSDLGSEEAPNLSFGVRTAEGEPLPIDSSQMGDLAEVGSPRNRTWNISFLLLNKGAEPAEFVGSLDGEEFEIALSSA